MHDVLWPYYQTYYLSILSSDIISTFTGVIIVVCIFIVCCEQLHAVCMLT